jgi:capsid protein
VGGVGEETHFPIKLRVAEKSRNRDGECFGIFATRERLASPVKLFVRWVEAEQCATPYPDVGDPYATDGVRFDRFGMPLEYDFLKFHPGDFAQVGSRRRSSR